LRRASLTFKIFFSYEGVKAEYFSRHDIERGIDADKQKRITTRFERPFFETAHVSMGKAVYVWPGASDDPNAPGDAIFADEFTSVITEVKPGSKTII
jgi:hypothetical protein